MTIVAYARVSSTGQSLDVQLDQLKQDGGAEKVFSEKRTGTTTSGREELERALDWVREGDVFVVTRLDRLARSMTDLSQIIKRLNDKGVGFRCLQQGAIDTTKAEGRLMLNIFGSFAEFETDLRKERQREGIDLAISENRYSGRPKTVDGTAIIKLKAEGVGPAEIARRLKIGRASVYRALAVDTLGGGAV